MPVLLREVYGTFACDPIPYTINISKEAPAGCYAPPFPPTGVLIMPYPDQFETTAYYYRIIDRLVDHYRSVGYVAQVYDWERQLRNIADLSDLRYLANKADFLYTNTKTLPL